ncbi:MAG TPA: helix-turn-helix domain-containing protein [Candidatus Paceibacterota bacterium]|jgi:predicted transcriptional regulator|nr:helix-turn-helix domain-containing protein [Candidatus Paceibacterota bacterium]
MDHGLKTLRENLAILGLIKSEQDMYFLLMEIQSPQPVSVLAGELGVPRQTANTILKNMAKRGIIIETKHRGKSCFHTNRDQTSKYIDATISRLQIAKKIIIAG